MGLTSRSTGTGVLETELKIEKSSPKDMVIALAGNPNVGKSTVFNNLTGLNQHTGNWPGKTVTNAQGKYRHKSTNFIMVDIPGTYSLMANSAEEEVARDFICFGEPDAVVVVADATCLERNLNLVLQTLEITRNVVVCVNLIDEAERKKIKIDYNGLAKQLGVPVIPTNARSNKGLSELMDAVHDLTHKNISTAPIKITYDEVIEEAISVLVPVVGKYAEKEDIDRWISLKLLEADSSLTESLNKYLRADITEQPEVKEAVEKGRGVLAEGGISPEDLRDKIVFTLFSASEKIFKSTVTFQKKQYNKTDRKIDRVLTSRVFGIPIMLILLGLIFWITIYGANYPSQMLTRLFYWVEQRLNKFFMWAGSPEWLHAMIVKGVYKTTAWVVAVMLPPMAIFFPLFTLLEDLGYLPRIAFNLDNFFKKACAHGKQALTMCMGFGCNAAGVIGCRIIDSPRERLIAIITNNFVPCNGRFPTLITIITIFFAGLVIGPFQSVVSTLILLSVIVFAVFMTLFISKLLSKTILKGLPSSFALELPPYRRPQIGKVIVRSIFDRTIFVLGRAVSVAIPAGLIIWVMANVQLGNASILSHCADFLDPFAKLIGMDGYILLAFILGFPANEIVIPIILMSYTASGSIFELESLSKLKTLLVANGWTWLTAVCVMLFSLMHWPCGTTCFTIKKETQSLKWTLVSFAVPTVAGIIICFVLTSVVRLLGLV